MAALQHADVPGYAALLLRRTFRDLSLPGALIPRSHEWLAGTDARWDGVEHSWTFPSGAVAQFGYLDADQDRYRYQSSAYQFIGWDELTQFVEEEYLWMFSRLRTTTGVDVPLRVRSATNPGGLGHRWVKRRFIDAETCAPGAVFVPARVTDNPHLRADYADSLGYLDPVTRARYLDGDWEVVEDNIFVFSRFDRRKHCQRPPSIDPTFMRCIFAGVDPGTSDPYAVTVWGLDWDGNLWQLDEFYRRGGTTTSFAEEFKALHRKWNIRTWFVDKRKPSDIIDLQRAGLPAIANLELHGETGKGTIRPMLAVVIDALNDGRLHLHPDARETIREFEEYRYKQAEDKNRGEVPVDAQNHCVDSARYACCSVIEGGVPGVELVWDRHNPPKPEKRPGSKPKVPTREEYLKAFEDAQDQPQEWTPFRG